MATSPTSTADFFLALNSATSGFISSFTVGAAFLTSSFVGMATAARASVAAIETISLFMFLSPFCSFSFGFGPVTRACSAVLVLGSTGTANGNDSGF